MAWLDSCTPSVENDFDSQNSIIQNSQDSLRELKEEGKYISEEAFQSIWRYFDTAFTDQVFDSKWEIYDTIIFAVGFALSDFGFEFEMVNGIDKIDELFTKNNLAPISQSILFTQNKEGKHIMAGSISKLTCTSSIDTSEFIPQDTFPLVRDIEIPFYGEVLYDFPGDWSVGWSFQYGTKNIYIFDWVINTQHSDDEEKKSYVNLLVANELGHFQFHEIIVPLYEIDRDDIFNYHWNKYTFRQIDELWSDFSSLFKVYKDYKVSWNSNPTNHELRRIIWDSHWIVGYDLTRQFWLDMQNIKPVITDGNEYFTLAENRIIEILESAKY